MTDSESTHNKAGLRDPKPPAHGRPFVPDTFVVPQELRTATFLLVPLGAEHNVSDYAAWSSSIEHILATPGFIPAEGDTEPWPHPMSLADNLADLVEHADHFERRLGFTYTVLDPVAGSSPGEVIGCVYIYPVSDDASLDAKVSSWVRADRRELDAELWRTVTDWLASAWPFEHIRYDERDG
jgi:hypothetical protein